MFCACHDDKNLAGRAGRARALVVARAPPSKRQNRAQKADAPDHSPIIRTQVCYSYLLQCAPEVSTFLPFIQQFPTATKMPNESPGLRRTLHIPRSPQRPRFSSIASSHRRGLHHWQIVLITWGPLLWAIIMFYVEYEWEPVIDGPNVIMDGVLEGVRPPRQTIVWPELYSKMSRRRTEESTANKPRTWPSNYVAMPCRTGIDRKATSRQSSSTLKELRHLPSSPPNCEPKSAWHSYSFPNCNNMHELDFLNGIVPPAEHPSADHDAKDELYIEYMFSGGTRESWLVQKLCTDGSDCVVPGLNATEGKSTGPKVILKTLNWPVEHDEVVYDHQRIDALASERLTSSPHVVDIYGFCGVSALNEFADGGNFGRMIRHKNNDASISPEELLLYAREAALGLADIHEIDGRGNVTSLVHHDFSAKNFLTVNGKLKVSDFNDGKLLQWDASKGKRCRGFDWDGLCGTNTERTHRRAPEECMGDKYRRLTTEKVEVYHLGAFFFFLLTDGGWPYQFEVSQRGNFFKLQASAAKEAILKGQLPALPPDVQASNNAATKALVQAMKWTYTFEAKKRPAARAVAEFLDRKLKMIQESS